jgi:hypothetical protein
MLKGICISVIDGRSDGICSHSALLALVIGGAIQETSIEEEEVPELKESLSIVVIKRRR